MGNQSYYLAHPFAVNIYHGRRHVQTFYFTRQQPAQFYMNHACLYPGESAHLMEYRGDYRWKELSYRRKVARHA